MKIFVTNDFGTTFIVSENIVKISNVLVSDHSDDQVFFIVHEMVNEKEVKKTFTYEDEEEAREVRKAVLNILNDQINNAVIEKRRDNEKSL